MSDARNDIRKPFMPGKKLLKTTAPGQPDTWSASGLIGCYVLDLTLERTGDGILVKGVDRITNVQVKDLMVEQDGRLAGKIFYVNKNSAGEAYLNLITTGEDGMTGGIL